jgi:glutamate dehydrogenase/leucine dehydrogenase
LIISIEYLFRNFKDPFLIMADKRVAQISGHLNFPKGMLAGQVAIITGSGQGIGAETARLFANEGAKVVVSDIDASMLYAWSFMLQ